MHLEKGSPRLGRPRAEGAGPALLRAARRQVLEHGYKRVSVTSITLEAGVSRQVFYRLWVGKADLVVDAFLKSASKQEDIGELQIADALFSFLKNLFATLETDGPAIRNLIATAQADRLFLTELKERLIEPRRMVLAQLIRRAIERGEVRVDADVNTATEVLYGAFWYRLLQGEVLDEAVAQRLATFVMRSIVCS